MSGNESRRLAAEKAGRVTFRYEVVDDWPGCTACGRPIRRNIEVPGRIGMQRLCDCPDIYWHFPPTGGPPERIQRGT